MAGPLDAREAPPFDQGLFLLHFNKGKELLQEGDLENARKELEGAARLRPNDEEVLNLLGLVYFKSNAHEEAERIYRRLLQTNPEVFILHSNLGLVLFKQGKLDEAERELHRSIELKPNYTKSHLYLGLLYRQRGKLGLAHEHLTFAGATRPAKEVEEQLRKGPPAGAPAARPAATTQHTASGETSKIPLPPRAPAPTVPPPSPAATAAPEPARGPLRPAIPGGRSEALPPAATGALGGAALLESFHARDTAAAGEAAPRKLALDPGRRTSEGPNRTFTLKENGYLEIHSSQTVYVKRGTVSTYTGNLRFSGERNLAGTSADFIVRVDGQGKLFLYEKGRRTFLIDLDNEFIYVEGHNLLAMEESLSFRKEPIFDYARNRKIDAIKLYGRGSLAISTAMEPLTLRVTRDFPLNLSSESLVAWTGELIPTVLDDSALADVMTSAPAGFRIRFEGEGVVIAEEA